MVGRAGAKIPLILDCPHIDADRASTTLMVPIPLVEGSMKLFRYRRPSVNTLLGITRIKKQIKKDLGITAALKPFRAASNAERRLKRRLGYYSPLGRLIRLGVPTVFGLRSSAKPQAAAPAAPRPSGIKLSSVAIFLLLGTIAASWGSILGGCDLRAKQSAPPQVATLPLPSEHPTAPSAISTSGPESQAIDVPLPRVGSDQPEPSIYVTASDSIKQSEAEAANDDLIGLLEPRTSRQWADRTGKFHTTALLLGVVDGIAQLQRPDKTLHVPVAKLSDDDFAYLASTGISTEPRTLTGKVVGVLDGDTILVLDEHKTQHKIRLAGIDAPERTQAFGHRSREALAKKVFQEHVAIHWRQHDKYGRTIGDVFLGSRWINQEAVAEGLAWHYLKYSDSKELSAAEETARRSGTGLWAHADAEAPWQFRSRDNEKPRPNPIAKLPTPKEARSTPKPRPPTASPESSTSEVQVRGYFRKDGTYVRPHTRKRPSR